MRAAVHVALHFILPAAVARFGTRSRRFQTFLWLMAGLCIDLDHLWANPVYDPNRCSVGFHTLHRWEVLPLYVLLCLFPKTRWLGVGLCLHIALDLTDCWWMVWS